MNIVLLGYGKTGRDIETAAIERGHTISDRFTSHRPFTASACSSLVSRRVDCCVDFSVPDAVVPHISVCMQHGIPIVVGTTGWHAQLAEVTALVGAHHGTLVHAANFSLGMHVFLKIVSAAAQLFDAFPDYDAAIHEVHHRLKKDAPSGTARTIAAIVLESLGRKERMQTQPSASGIAADELHVSSTRLGTVFGTHTVSFSSTSDQIDLTHRASDRRGFALGAVMAAEWVQGKQGVFTADDVFF